MACDRHLALRAEDRDEHALSRLRAHAGVERVEMSELTRQDADALAALEHMVRPWCGCGRQSDDAELVHAAAQGLDLSIRDPRRDVTEADDAKSRQRCG
jgi:hypothetical protein